MSSINKNTNVKSGGTNGGVAGFHELRKQASFFLKEKIKTARLALTDVTPAQLLAEEATNGSPGGPDARTLKMISKAAFEVDDYWRIVDILHKRLVRFDKSNWRPSYKALIVVEHLLTHGPERVAEEFQIDSEAISKMESFQYIDDQGFNWGLNVRKKCQRVLKLLENSPLLKEEREKARRISRGIQGFGSFCSRTRSHGPQDALKESSQGKVFGRSYSESDDHQQVLFLAPNQSNVTSNTKSEKPLHLEKSSLGQESVDSQETLGLDRGVSDNLIRVRETSEGSTNRTVEWKPLLGAKKNSDGRMEASVSNIHPFDDETDHLTAISLLSAADEY